MGTAPEREVKVGSECAASPREESVLLVLAAVPHFLTKATRQVVRTWHETPCSSCSAHREASLEEESHFGQNAKA